MNTGAPLMVRSDAGFSHTYLARAGDVKGGRDRPRAVTTSCP
jgi:hypothetical protein